MSKKPWMPLYIGDYLRKTTHLDATGSGAYLHLIMHYWDHGSLPDDDRELRRIAKLSPYFYKKLRPVLAKFFEPGWRHNRIDEELQRFEKTSLKRSLAGVIGAAARQANAKRLLKPGYIQSDYRLRKKEALSPEKVLRSKEAASRTRKGNGTLEPTPELIEVELSKDRKP